MVVAWCSLNTPDNTDNTERDTGSESTLTTELSSGTGGEEPTLLTNLALQANAVWLQINNRSSSTNCCQHAPHKQCLLLTIPIVSKHKHRQGSRSCVLTWTQHNNTTDHIVHATAHNTVHATVHRQIITLSKRHGLLRTRSDYSVEDHMHRVPWSAHWFSNDRWHFVRKAVVASARYEVTIITCNLDWSV
jgi:hypothetical protein